MSSDAGDSRGVRCLLEVRAVTRDTPRGRPCPCCQSPSHVYRVTNLTLEGVYTTRREHHCLNPTCRAEWFSYQTDDPNFSCPIATDNTTNRHL